MWRPDESGESGGRWLGSSLNLTGTSNRDGAKHPILQSFWKSRWKYITYTSTTVYSTGRPTGVSVRPWRLHWLKICHWTHHRLKPSANWQSTEPSFEPKDAQRLGLMKSTRTPFNLFPGAFRVQALSISRNNLQRRSFWRLFDGMSFCSSVCRGSRSFVACYTLVTFLFSSLFGWKPMGAMCYPPTLVDLGLNEPKKVNHTNEPPKATGRPQTLGVVLSARWSHREYDPETDQGIAFSAPAAVRGGVGVGPGRSVGLVCFGWFMVGLV